MCTHGGIISTSVLGLYRSIRMLWYEKSGVWGWMGPVSLVIFVDTANSFAHGNSEQKIVKNNNDEN